MRKGSMQECAALVADTIPMVMRTIRREVDRRGLAEVSVPQFRALMCVKHHRGASLSLVSNHLGSTISSTSKLIDGLVGRKYITREIAAEDRRRVILVLTALGEATLGSVHQSVVTCLADILRGLSASDRATVTRAMELLRSAFASRRAGKVEAARQGEPIC